MTNWLDENKPKIDELIKQGKSSREIAKVLDTFNHDPDTNWFDSDYDSHLVIPKFPHTLFQQI